MTAAERDKEALRQQMLLRALFGDARPGVVGGWLRERPERVVRGLQAYRANAGALAEKVLAAAFPTVVLLIGDDAAAGVARAFWRADPPQRGDMAQWGAGLPAFIAADPQLASEPYLADVARLDWAVRCAEMAADAPSPTGLHLLASADPAKLWLELVPGTALVSSVHPIAAIWQAHRPTPAGPGAGEDPDRFAPVRAAFAAGTGEHALVARCGGDWFASVSALPPADAAFTAALLAGRCLTDALADALDHALTDAHADEQAGARPGARVDSQAETRSVFEFEPWLIDNLQQRRIAAVTQRFAAA